MYSRQRDMAHEPGAGVFDGLTKLGGVPNAYLAFRRVLCSKRYHLLCPDRTRPSAKQLVECIEDWTALGGSLAPVGVYRTLTYRPKDRRLGLGVANYIGSGQSDKGTEEYDWRMAGLRSRVAQLRLRYGSPCDSYCGLETRNANVDLRGLSAHFGHQQEHQAAGAGEACTVAETIAQWLRIWFDI